MDIKNKDYRHDIDSKVTRRQHVASHDSTFTLTATLAEALGQQLYLSLTTSLEILTAPSAGISYCHQKRIPMTASLAIRILSARLRLKFERSHDKAHQFQSMTNLHLLNCIKIYQYCIQPPPPFCNSQGPITGIRADRLFYKSEIMTSMQKSSSIKIPAFDKENYNVWKRKSMLFIKAANPLYLGILQNGHFVPRKEIEASTVDGVLIPAYWVNKLPSEFLEP
ncbi:hypothetical protein POM88_027240 [Heracleum sosnowskyi]|uniref:Uncharacterized protein n=1 Tax=Heracleum sosnowskyi TaxID=360622 RepID=A0AAD8I7J5_9APIA|nr:hypothetical protein POM88_027240 [Heracleum sosnowskyi]